MSNLSLNVAWSDNTEALRRNLSLGLTQVSATKDAVDKLVNSLSGERQIQAADKWAQALMRLGDQGNALSGVQKLTSSEIDRANTVIDKAIAKYQALGTTAPAALTDISNALHQAAGDTSLETRVSAVGKAIDELRPPTDNAHAAFTNLRGTLDTMWQSPTASIEKFSGAIAQDLTSNLGAIGVAAGIAGAGLVTAGAVILGLGEHAASVGAAINDFSEKMQLSSQSTSKLKYASDVVGSSLEQTSTLIFQIQRRMEESPEDFERGLGRIGLSLNDIRGLKGDEMLYAISKGFRDNAKTANLAATSTELFSKAGRDAIPLLMKDLSGLSDEAERLGYVWSKEDTDAAESFELSTRKLHEQWSQFSTNIGRLFIPALANLAEKMASIAVPSVGKPAGTFIDPAAQKNVDAFQSSLKAMQGQAALSGLALQGLTIDIHSSAAEIGDAASRNSTYNAEVEKLKQAIGSLTIVQQGQIDVLKGLGDGEQQIATIVGISEQTVRKYLDTQKAAVEAAKEAAKQQAEQQRVWDAYNAVGLNVVDTINKIDGATLEGIKFDLARGQSVETLTKIYGVHKESIQAIEQEQKFLASITDTATGSFHGLYLVVPDLTKRTQEFTYAMQGLTKDGLIPTAAGFDDLARAQKANDVFTQQQQKSIEALETQLAHIVGLMPDLSSVAHQTMEGLSVATHSWADGLDSASRALSEVAGVNLGPLLKSIQQLVDGTGDIWKVVQAGAGTVADATDEPSTTAGQYTHDISRGAQIGTAILPGWGTLIGGAAGAVVAALSVSPEEKAARALLEDFEKGYGSLEDTIRGVGEQYAMLGKSGAEAQHDLQAAFDASHQSAEAEAAAIAKINSVLDQARQRQQDVADGIKAVGPAFNAIVAGAGKSKASLDALGIQALATFTASVAGGQSVAETLDTLGPSLTTIQQGYTALGLDVDNGALKNLLMQNTVLQGNPQLIAAVGGLGSEMEALNKLGVLNVDTFEAMERTGADTYSRLQAQVAAVGGTTKDALIPMQAYLHDAAYKADQLGIPLDDNTQLLIDQSKELGIWRDTGQDATKALNDSANELNNTMKSLIDSLTGPGGLTDAFHGIPSTIDVTVVRNYVDSPAPPPSEPNRQDARWAARSSPGVHTSSEKSDRNCSCRTKAAPSYRTCPRSQCRRRCLACSSPTCKGAPEMMGWPPK
jgi:hypothetical protein